MNEIIGKFTNGTGVRIIENCQFKAGTIGMINYSPDTQIITELFDNNYFRKVQTLRGEKIFMWMVFDNPQFDDDGDGPYVEAEIDAENLEVIK